MKRLTEIVDNSSHNLLSFKKKRAPKQKANKKYSKRDEDRIFKFAIKQSEIEYKELQEKTIISEMTYSTIPPCTTVYATEDDFLNPITFFESIWDKNNNSTGIIKIVPPENWKNDYSGVFKNTYLKKFEECDKKLETRKMNLTKLYMAKVNLYYIKSILIRKN